MAMQIVSTKPRSWLEFEHPEYQRLKARWQYATVHYTGELLADGVVKDYLVRRFQAETDSAYDERSRLADFVPYFAHVVDSMAGMLFAVEDQATRTFNPAGRTTLGSPEDGETIIGKLWDNADGQGNGWLTLFKILTIELEICHNAWVFVDPADGTPRVRVLPALQVPNWVDDDAGLAEVLVKEPYDARTSLEQEAKEAVRYLKLTRQGWQRYTLDDKGKPVPSGEPGVWTFEDAAGRPTLPIYRVRLPLNRHVGWLLAKRNNAIFNAESSRDHILRVANFPRLNLMADDVLYKKLVAALAKGANALQAQPGQGAHSYIAPSAEPARVATEMLRDKVENFYVTGFREYGSSAQAKERTTATQVRQEVSAGVGAFLEMLAGALDDAENRALWLIEQAQFKSRNDWFHSRVARSRDFTPFDVNAEIERLTKRYFGDSQNQPLPVGLEARLQAVKQICAWDGLEYDERAAREALQLNDMLRAKDVAATLAIGSLAKGSLTVTYLRALGLITEPELEEAQAAVAAEQPDQLTLDLATALDESRALAKTQEDAATVLGAGPNFGGM